MPLNIPGLLVPFQLLWNPRLVVPHVVVKDIRQIDFLALRKAGYRGAVFDKDNCLTVPYKDHVVPELQNTWTKCRDAFGEGNVLIVSNSAGTRFDAGEIQAESVSHHLSVPVLRHNTLKPSYSCISSVRQYFSSLRAPIPDEELIVVGDRVFTDVVMANRMARRTPSPTESRCGPLAIWTRGVWKKESMAMRWCEKRLVDIVNRWTSGGHATASAAKWQLTEDRSEMAPVDRWYTLAKIRSVFRK
ncbi:HAD-superfamily phosphatase [Leucogyrophana mollusca]|uniref:HAD-superfamily phosphatase n=1 Tax=Leucogyrophana mollusca TaxID=85980 RepID=A0ACB8BJH8_9AGAM|nr:HAD-superfamily phosphatase [Leucogyrophana mollusca]